MGREERPLLNTEQQIQHLKSKGVRFELISEADAVDYLRKNNNYFKLRAFRKNFEKNLYGEKAGQYINLDFAMLKDLSIIDMKLRYTALQMALDVEHFAKVKLLRETENAGEDGYSIVEAYFNSLQKKDAQNYSHRYNTLMSELNRNRGNPYCGGIVEKYHDDYPIWAFVEIIPFGSLIHFYEFCADRFRSTEMKKEFYLLLCIKDLRNAAAHSNCILHDMTAEDAKGRPSYDMLQYMNTIGRDSRRNQLSNERMRQVCTLLYIHSLLVKSEGVHQATKDLLLGLKERIDLHWNYYNQHLSVQSNLLFLKKTIDIFFP